jgi:WD40 repeat protein
MGGEEGAVLVWDLKNPGAPPVVLRGHTGAITALAFAPDGRLATAGRDGAVLVWDLKNPAATPGALRGHEGPIETLAFAPDGRLAIGGRDGAARLWDLKNPGAPPVVLRGHEGGIYALAFAPDGRLVVGDTRAARVWSIDLDSQIKLAERVAGRNLSSLEWEQFLGREPYRRTFPGLPDVIGVGKDQSGQQAPAPGPAPDAGAPKARI